MDVTVVLVSGGAPSTAVAPVEIFSSAGVLWNTLRGESPDPRFQVRTASLDGRPVQTGFGGLRLEPDCTIEEIDATDLAVIAAVGVDLDTACRAHASLSPWLRRQYRQGAVIAGACAGVALIAESGLLDGRCATTHWGVVEACRQRYPAVRWQPEQILTESDRIVCAGGVYAAVDLSLYLIEKLYGHTLGMETARALVLDTPRTWQVGYSAEPPDFDHADARIARVQEWLFHHFDECISIEELAERAAMSERTFARRFRMATGEKPMRYVQKLRINVARHLLENDARSVQEVGQAVGYDDVKFFRTLFRRFTGATPQAYRKRFAIDPRADTAPPGRHPQR
jgi:transcriptional regulator GlxA family with amidase domain